MRSADGSLELRNFNHLPRPKWRGMVFGLASTLVVAANRSWDILSDSQADAALSGRTGAAAAWAVGAGAVAGLAVWFNEDRERRKLEDEVAQAIRDKRSKVAVELLTGRADIVFSLSYLSSELVRLRSAEPGSVEQKVGLARFEKDLVDLMTVTMKSALPPSVKVRSTSFQFTQEGLIQVSLSGDNRHHELERRSEEFVRAAQDLVRSGSLIWSDPSEGKREPLALPGNADYLVRAPNRVDGSMLGVLCVDVWGDANFTQFEAALVAPFANLLSIALSLDPTMGMAQETAAMGSTPPPSSEGTIH